MKNKILLFVFSLILFGPFITHAVTVGPVKLEYSLNPGDIVNGEIYLKNEETDTLTFYPIFERFTEQNGNKVFIKGDSLLTDWFKSEPSVTLKSGEDKKVSYTLTIPQDAPPGGQFGVLWWGTNPPNTTGTEQVSIQTRAGILVYINISGNVIDTAEITSLGLASKKNVSWGGPAAFNIKISNTGNVYIKPAGDLKIQSVFGTTPADLPINPKEFQILPGSYREIGDMEWTPGIFSIGPYKVTANLLYGDKGNTLSSSKWIWVLPIKSIGLVLGVIIILILFFKWYNRFLLRKYKGMS